jgi:hypothetical protein
MEERKLDCSLMLVGDAPGRDRVDAVPSDVAMGDDSPFGQARCTTCIVDSPWVIQAQFRDIFEF